MLKKSIIFIIVTLVIFFVFYFFISREDNLKCEYPEFSPYGILITPLSRKPNFTREASVCDDTEKTIYSTNQNGILTNIDHFYIGKHVYSYSLESIISLWDKYHRFTDTFIVYSDMGGEVKFDYFGNKGIPYFENSLFCKPDGGVFNGEMIVNWSSQYVPPNKGKSRITFRNGLLWQIAENKNDESIVFLFDMDKIIFLTHFNNTLLEKHIEPNSPFYPRDFIFCTDTQCFFYHPFESICPYPTCWGPPNYFETCD